MKRPQKKIEKVTDPTGTNPVEISYFRMILKMNLITPIDYSTLCLYISVESYMNFPIVGGLVIKGGIHEGRRKHH